MRYNCHIFICTNSPNNTNKCGSKNSEKLRLELKEKAKALHLEGLRINSSGCLGACEKGVAAVMYPQNKWYYELTENSCDFLLEDIKSEIKK